ncbi:hypothetical protein R3P38DRAFT_2948524 [Favolaschia claudopus]|uniref:Uncharacterized protein n=1 Tax=Favolaschia claudopus TaxID=2862362 RepID=A0AAW0APB6_9AGAR
MSECSDSYYPGSSDDIVIPCFSQRDSENAKYMEMHWETVMQAAKDQHHRRRNRYWESKNESVNVEVPRQAAVLANTRNHECVPGDTSLNTESDYTRLYNTGAALDSDVGSQEWMAMLCDPETPRSGALYIHLRDATLNLLLLLEASSEASSSTQKAPVFDQLDFELLRLEYSDMEADRDQELAENEYLRNKYTELESKNVQLEQQLTEARASLRFFEAEMLRWKAAATSASLQMQTWSKGLSAAAQSLEHPPGM